MKTVSHCSIVGLAVLCLLLAACSGAPIKTGGANQRIDTTNIDFNKGRRKEKDVQDLFLIPAHNKKPELEIK